MPEAPVTTQPDYAAAMAAIEAAYPGINDDGTCRHGDRFDRCPTCSHAPSHPLPQDNAP